MRRVTAFLIGLIVAPIMSVLCGVLALLCLALPILALLDPDVIKINGDGRE